MRITCPNCDAQYEVGEDAIPEAGRDVQCSNCGHTWWQHGPGHVPEEQEASPEAGTGADMTRDPKPESEPALRPDPDISPAPDPEAGPETGPDTRTGPGPEPDPHTAPEDTPDATEAAVANLTRDGGASRGDAAASADGGSGDDDGGDGEQTGSGLDPEVERILREEAAYEAKAREAERLESQPDLGIRDPEEDPRSAESRRRMARLRGDPDHARDIAAEVTATAASAGGRLPDVEEINSTLRGDAPLDDPAETAAAAPRKRRGFRTGFLLVLLIGLVLFLGYVFAPQIIAAVPALEGTATAYVEAVNGLRLWVDTQLQGLIEALSSTAAPGDGAATTGN